MPNEPAGMELVVSTTSKFVSVEPPQSACNTDRPMSRTGRSTFASNVPSAFDVVSPTTVPSMLNSTFEFGVQPSPVTPSTPPGVADGLIVLSTTSGGGGVALGVGLGTIDAGGGGGSDGGGSSGGMNVRTTTLGRTVGGGGGGGGRVVGAGGCSSGGGGNVVVVVVVEVVVVDSSVGCCGVNDGGEEEAVVVVGRSPLPTRWRRCCRDSDRACPRSPRRLRL